MSYFRSASDETDESNNSAEGFLTKKLSRMKILISLLFIAGLVVWKYHDAIDGIGY